MDLMNTVLDIVLLLIILKIIQEIKNKAPSAHTASRWAEKIKRFVTPMCVFDRREKNYARAIKSFLLYKKAISYKVKIAAPNFHIRDGY